MQFLRKILETDQNNLISYFIVKKVLRASRQIKQGELQAWNTESVKWNTILRKKVEMTVHEREVICRWKAQ